MLDQAREGGDKFFPTIPAVLTWAALERGEKLVVRQSMGVGVSVASESWSLQPGAALKGNVRIESHASARSVEGGGGGYLLPVVAGGVQVRLCKMAGQSGIGPPPAAYFDVRAAMQGGFRCHVHVEGGVRD
jgi:hypothetical protein